MNETSSPIAAKDLPWRRALGIVIIACLALSVWELAHTRPPTPGIKRAPAQAPAQQLPMQRATESADPQLICLR